MRSRLARLGCLGILVVLASGSCARPAPDTEPGWLGTMQRHIAAREYWASEHGEGLQAPNRRHNLRTWFEASGVRVHDRTAGGSPQLVALSLSGVGRGETLSKVEAATEVVAHEGRVEIRRPGLVEWYVNSPEGLEQGFTLAERSDGDGELVVELAVAGAKASERGEDVVFATAAGRKLDYGAIAAEDAEGTPLTARFDVANTDRVRLVVDDTDARYPIVIDPLLTESADTQLEGNEDFANFGVSVAGAGDVNGDGFADVIVGAYLYDAGGSDEGAAFVFHGSASGIPDVGPAAAAAQLESNQNGARMGVSVAGAGDVDGDGYADVIVGAYQWETVGAGTDDEGAAFVFLSDGSSGIADGHPGTADAVLEGNQAGASMGYSVAGAGDVDGNGYGDVIVGAYLFEGPVTAHPNEGAAFVFLSDGTSGIAHGNSGTADAALESNQANAFFGLGVAGAGDVDANGYADVIVSAQYYDAPETDEGAAFVFHGSATGIAHGTPATAAAQIESDQVNGRLGSMVAGAGDVNGDGYGDLIVGAGEYDAGTPGEGSAFVFHGGPTGIVANGDPVNANTRLESNQADGVLGRTVCGAGDVNGDGYADVIVGAPGFNAPDANEGAAFVFLGSASGIPHGDPATAAAQLESDQADADLGGYGVAGAGDVNGDGYADVIAGAWRYDGGRPDEGAAFIYHGGASGIVDGSPATAAAQIESDQGDAFLGGSAASAGDVNRDGYADVIVGVPNFDGGQANEGAVYVFHGSAAGIAGGHPTDAATQLESNQPNASFGASVASAGDVNGDGFADVIVGAYGYESDALDAGEGAAFVFHGTASGIDDGNPATAAAQLESNQVNAGLGFSVSGAGDVNGDGYADVIVGASQYDAPEGAEGAAFVFHGGMSGIGNGNPASAAAQLESNQADAALGYSVANAGDVNGDGYADVIVGAAGYEDGQTDEGAAFVFWGSASGISDGNPATAATRIQSDQPQAFLGRAVAGAGDVDGDGYADVIVGAGEYSAPEVNEGAAFVFLSDGVSGIASGNPATASARLEANQVGAALGYAVAGAGDTNGDGYADVIVGAQGYDAGSGPGEGAAFVFYGGSSGISDGNPSTAAAQLEGDQGLAGLGASVAGAGDVNGDGYADVVIGAPVYDAPSSNEGAVFVFLGNDATGRPVLARQRRGDGSGTPVQPFGRSLASGAFAAELRANHPAGRGRVKAQLQACPPGVSFGGGTCTNVLTPTWINVNGTTPDVLLSHPFTGLANNTLYRWRARVLHAPATGVIPPNPAHGPWRRLDAQAVEADIRLPEPGLLVSLASGVALLAALARRSAAPRFRSRR